MDNREFMNIVIMSLFFILITIGQNYTRNIIIDGQIKLGNNQKWIIEHLESEKR